MTKLKGKHLHENVLIYAQPNTATSLAITESVNQDRPWKPLRLGVALLKRFWWHTHAYGTVLGIMLLTVVSMIFLYIHWSCRKLLSVLTNRNIKENELDILSSK